MLSKRRAATGGSCSLNEDEQIDVTFDFRTDSQGRDPDSHSPTLRSYHQFLWNKKLPSGALFTLDDSQPRHYLYHWSRELGEFSLTSDTVVPSFSRVPRMASIMAEMPPGDVDAFNSIGYTMGGMMVWPGNRIDGKMTMNQARGCYGRIRDRFDFTLECIRRHYRGGQPSPLSEVLARYTAFFDLFKDFRGYVEFFLLQDLVEDDFSAVRFHTPFEDFGISPPIPRTVDDYAMYRKRAIGFIEARNRRILRYCSEDRAGEAPLVVKRPTEAVLDLAEQYHTRDKLERAMKVASAKGLRVRLCKTCLMFAPPSNATRCLFTIWAKPEQDCLKAWVGTEPFTEFFALEQAHVEKMLGPEGWRLLNEEEFEAFLRQLEALDLES